MIAAQFEVLIIAVLSAIACAIPGVFLVLKRNSLMSDAISHSVLLGIVLMFLWVRDLYSPWLFIGAVSSGLMTVFLVELIIGTRRVKVDAAIGLVFPLFFAIGVILINIYTRDIHLDADMVLLGDIALAPLDRFYWNGIDFGPRAVWVMAGVGLLNIIFVGLFFKELSIMIFDAALATSLGLAPTVVYYMLMTIVSVTAVAAFDVVGSILVVALMITPAATAYLMTKRLSIMVIYSVMVAIASAIAGYGLAMWADASVPGAIATINGVIFLAVFLFVPKRGVVAKLISHRKQRLLFSLNMVLVQCYDHEGTPQESTENTLRNLVTHMGWTDRFSRQVVRLGVQENMLRINGQRLFLTDLGRVSVKELLVR